MAVERRLHGDGHQDLGRTAPGLAWSGGHTVRMTFVSSTGYVQLAVTDRIDGVGDRELLPGQTLNHTTTWRAVGCGDQAGKYCILLGPGDYTLTVRWTFDSPVAEASAPVRLV